MAQCFAKANDKVNNPKMLAAASIDMVKLKYYTHIYGTENKYAFKCYSALINRDAVYIVYIDLRNNLHFEYIIVFCPKLELKDA